MRFTPRQTIAALAFAVLALLASSCGGSGSSASEVSTGDASSASSETAPSTSSSSSDGDVPESPIADLLGIPISDSGEMEEYFADLGRQAEVKIAQCMLVEGFEYSVVDYGDLGGVSVAGDEDREYAEEYGFGITSNPFEESIEAFEQFDDPNADYVASLTPGEQEAYYATLYGADTGEQSETFGPGGCTGEAFEEVFSFGVVFEQFGDQFAEIEQAYESDPRIVDASSGWSECMTAAGYRYTDEDGASSDIRRRYQAIVNNPDAPVNPDEAGGFPSSSGGDDEDFVFFGPVTLKPEYQAQVDSLADEERAIATASWDCNAPLREIEDDVRLEYEQKFVDENGAAISAALGE